jgi:hypothetical protein
VSVEPGSAGPVLARRFGRSARCNWRISRPPSSHLGHVRKGDRKPQVPPHAPENDVARILTPFEGIRRGDGHVSPLPDPGSDFRNDTRNRARRVGGGRHDPSDGGKIAMQYMVPVAGRTGSIQSSAGNGKTLTLSEGVNAIGKGVEGQAVYDKQYLCTGLQASTTSSSVAVLLNRYHTEQKRRDASIAQAKLQRSVSVRSGAIGRNVIFWKPVEHGPQDCSRGR